MKTIKTISDANRKTRTTESSHEPATVSRHRQRVEGLQGPGEWGLHTRSRRFGLLDVQQRSINQSIKSNKMNTILNFIESKFRLIPVKYRFMAWVALAFISAISFMNIDSYGADKLGANWLLWVLGIVTGVAVLALAYVGIRENKK